MPDQVFEVTSFIKDLSVHFVQDTSHNDSGTQSPASTDSTRRLVIVGDVHGMRSELESLLESIDFKKDRGDRLILVGDLVNKGPDSPGVIDLAIKLGADVVRGNHDNAVLLAASAAKVEDDTAARSYKPECTAATDGQSVAEDADSHKVNDVNAAAKSGSRSAATARILSATQLEWLAGLPLMLRINTSASSSPDTEVIVVHAGLVPGIPLEKQDPHAIMHMRSLSGTADGSFTPVEKDGDETWAISWDKWQETKDVSEARTTVVFGHDAKRGLYWGKYAFGLDSSCVYGKKLSAMVMELTEGGVERRLVQVECSECATK